MKFLKVKKKNLELDKEYELTYERCSSQKNVKNMIDNRLVLSLCEDYRTEDMQEFNY